MICERCNKRGERIYGVETVKLSHLEQADGEWVMATLCEDCNFAGVALEPLDSVATFLATEPVAHAPTSVEMWVQTLNYWANELRKAQPALTQIAAVELVALVFGLNAVEGTDHLYRLPHTGHVVGSPEGEPFRAWPK